MAKRILTALLIFSIIIGGKIAGRNVLAEEDLSYIDDVTKLEAIKDDPEALSKVETVSAIAYEYDPRIEEDLKLIPLCPNLTNVVINAHDTRIDKEFINALTTTSDELTLSIQWGTVDLEGVENPYITALFLGENTVEHYENVLSFKNLEDLNLDNISGYCQIDYTKLPKLDLLALTSQRIESYRDFCQKAGNIRDLSLHCCNLKNRDTRYLTAYMKNLESLDLFGTYVDDITFLKDLPNLKIINLPIGVSDLSVLYELPNLQCVSFEAYTELFVDEELTSFFDRNGIEYTQYDKDIRNKVDQMIASFNIPENATEEEKIKIVTKNVILYMTCDTFDVSNIVGTTLDVCVNYKRGLCYDYATLHYTLLKSCGIDAYLMVGYSADAYNSSPGAHAWVEVCVDGSWYGIDAMWMDFEDGDPFSKENNDLVAYDYMKPTKVDASVTWPEEFRGHEDEIFALSHIVMNDPMDTLYLEDEPEEEEIIEVTASEEAIEETSEAPAVESPETSDEVAASSESVSAQNTPAMQSSADENGSSSKGISHKTFLYIGAGITIVAVCIVGFIFAKKRGDDDF